MALHKLSAIGANSRVARPRQRVCRASSGRALATFSDMYDITSRQTALVAIEQQWIEQM